MTVMSSTARNSAGMRTRIAKTAQLGELVVEFFDAAAHYSADPRVVSRLATGAVMRTLCRSQSNRAVRALLTGACAAP